MVAPRGLPGKASNICLTMDTPNVSEFPYGSTMASSCLCRHPAAIALLPVLLATAVSMKIVLIKKYQIP